LNRLFFLFEQLQLLLIHLLLQKKLPGLNRKGGFFVVATLPEYIDTGEMFKEAIEENVAYVPGAPFFADGKGQNTMRLSFCYPSEEDIDEGIKKLGQVIKKKIKK